MGHADVEYQGELNQNREGPRWKQMKRLKLDDTRRELKGRLDPARRFLETRHEAVRRRFEEEYALPAAVPVDIVSTGDVTGLIIDGWLEPLPYRGFYFPGTSISLAAVSNQPLRFLVDGAPVASGAWETPVVRPLTVRAANPSALP